MPLQPITPTTILSLAGTCRAAGAIPRAVRGSNAAPAQVAVDSLRNFRLEWLTGRLLLRLAASLFPFAVPVTWL